MKARIRKTGEVVEIISYSGNTDRNDVIDRVSYIDSDGVEHPREKLNFYWDFETITDEKGDTSTTDWNQVSIIINGVRFDAVEANTEFTCEECDLRHLCEKAQHMCLCHIFDITENQGFKKSDKKFDL